MQGPSAAVAAQVPAYFALILRAFSVIEGIALRVDPSYSIVKVAPRLLHSPVNAGQALPC